MGGILTIRVSAVTYDEGEVFRAWPDLCALAWPGKGEVSGRVWVPAVLPGALAAPLAADPVRRGVVELAQALVEEAQLGPWTDALRQSMRDHVADLEKQLGALEKALGDWQPQAAHAAAGALEDILDEMERTVTE